MRFAHKVGTPCPPDEHGGRLHIGPGGIRQDGQGVEWCCHSDRLLGPQDVARQRLETAARDKGVDPKPPEERPSRFPEQADLPDLVDLLPEQGEDGWKNAPDIVFDIGTLDPLDEEQP